MSNNGVLIEEAFLVLAQELGLDISKLQGVLAAMRRSQDAIERARRLLADDSQLQANEVDFIAFGSLARYEMTTSSDLDYLLVGSIGGDNASVDEVMNHAVERLRGGMLDGVKISEPGKSGLFGTIIDPDEITKAIGLQADTNHSLSRRLLFLEESVSLFNSAAHQTLMESILRKYLEARNPETRIVPRVLLNDIVRYWRTIAVDYHAKSTPESPYSLRYLKLLIPRKLCYLSALAPLYLMSVNDEKVSEIEFLLESFSQPAVVRLARLFVSASNDKYKDAAEVRQIAKVAFETLNEFIVKSGNSAWRTAVGKECENADPREMEHFGGMRKLGRELHVEVGKFFTADSMLPFTKEYMLS